VLGVERLALYTDHDRPLQTAEQDAYRDAIARRGRREPVAYIVGRKGFRALDLAVGPAVLVPRPETELLVEWGVEVAARDGTALDWGTGSGAVALALAAERSDLAVTAVDRSADALDVARGNDPGGVVEWLVSDGFAAVAGRTFDLVVANPPYLSDAELVAAAPELRFEPPGALASGPTGLEALRAIAAQAPAHMAPGAWLLAEVGMGQAPAVADLWRAAGLTGVTARDDLAGVPRVVGGWRP
jgi:release factor glutamine methyltransferase